MDFNRKVKFYCAASQAAALLKSSMSTSFGFGVFDRLVGQKNVSTLTLQATVL